MRRDDYAYYVVIGLKIACNILCKSSDVTIVLNHKYVRVTMTNISTRGVLPYKYY